tara:strand:+ start:4428 stop:5012 length:585 start_codon:yes stop_codon:yes gene_type:complete
MYIFDVKLIIMINPKISEIIRSRKSIYPREFNGQQIPDEIIMEILSNANYAPTHKMTQPWLFKIFSDLSKSKLLEKIIEIDKDISEKKIKKLKTKFEKSSHIICICMQTNKDLLPEWEEIAATSMAIQNIWISCVNSNIGGYWSTPKFITKINSFLSLKENEKCLGFFYIGIHNSKSITRNNRDNITEKVEWIR